MRKFEKTDLICVVCGEPVLFDGRDYECGCMFIVGNEGDQDFPIAWTEEDKEEGAK